MNNNQPNIVLITCDHLRDDFLGCAGHPIVQTPHIDQLARRGVRFSQACSTTPICIPARATIMTGMEGHTLGLTEFRPGFELPTEKTLPQQLRDAGYQTKVIGKMHTFPERRHYGFEQMLLCEEGRRLGTPYGENRGFDDYEQWLSEQGYPGLSHAHGLSINEYGVTAWHLPDHLHPTEWIGYQTCKEIKRRDWTRPQFIWASFTAPHPPLAPLMKDLYIYERDEIPKPYIGDWEENPPEYHQFNLMRYEDMNNDKKMDLAYRAFFALITQVDRQINRIVGTLKEEGLLENTWFILTSDHGDNLGDHNLWQKASFLKGSCNIPMIIAPPLNKEYQRNILGEDWIPGKESRAVVGLQDLLATCVDVAGAELPENIDGKSLVPLVRNENNTVRGTILGEFGRVDRRTLMVTDGLWKYIWFEEDGKELLFHIQEDPHELSNLIPTEPEELDRWRKKLISKLSKRLNDPAVVRGQLRQSSQSGPKTEEDRLKNFDYTFLHNSPIGLH